MFLRDALIRLSLDVYKWTYEIDKKKDTKSQLNTKKVNKSLDCL